MISSPHPNPQMDNFRQRLAQFKASEGHISLTEAQIAKRMAEGLAQHGDVRQALDVLRLEISRHGSAEAQAFFGFNPSLNLVGLLEELPYTDRPTVLVALLQSREQITLETVLSWPPEQQQDFVAALSFLQGLYAEQAEQSRAAVSFASQQADSLRAFLDTYQACNKLEACQ